MKTFFQIILVYIPFGIGILLQLLLLLTLYSDSAAGLASIAKVALPIIFMAACILHFFYRSKK
ncbi:MAG: hypothetical protein ACRCYO_01325 [Bacteroidia bacterium]